MQFSLCQVWKYKQRDATTKKSYQNKQIQVIQHSLQAQAIESIAQQKTGLGQTIQDEDNQFILGTYGRVKDTVFIEGKGAYLYDIDGKEYLDFMAGVAVNCLGHSHPVWVEAVQEQAAKLAHVSNYYFNVPQVELAKKLVQNSFADKVFFCNSGTEALEGAIKFTRKYAKQSVGIDPYSRDASQKAPTRFISFTNSFHGRTMGALALTYKQQYKTPFEPVMQDVSHVDFLDIEAVKNLVKQGDVAGIVVEPVQGEGGVISASKQFLQQLRDICDQNNIVLVFDEVQCGLGRTGKLFCYQHFGVEPDILTLAKPLAGGLPIGAVLVNQKVAQVMGGGDHGSTFAGNPLVCHVANKTFDILQQKEFLQDVQNKGQFLIQQLLLKLTDNCHVKDIRGKGLIVGIQLDQAALPVMLKAKEKGLLVITAGAGDTVRLVPPLIIADQDIIKATDILQQCISELQ